MAFDRIVGPLPDGGALPAGAPAPFSTIAPDHEEFVDRDGVGLWYAVYGTRGPWLAFAPPFQVVHASLLKATVPYLAEHCRVIVMDGRGNGRSDRPQGAEHYSFDLYYGDFVAVLDAAGADRVALVGISAAALTVLCLAGERPERVTHVITAGGFAESLSETPEAIAHVEAEQQRITDDWPKYLDRFMANIFPEPHSTKQYEDGVRYGWATTASVLQQCYLGWRGQDVRAQARRISCPTLVIHGTDDRRVPYAKGEAIHQLVPGARLLVIEDGGHVTAARDPVVFNRAVRDFVVGAPDVRRWTRAISRPRRALFICSPIGLGHAQRDLAIARELRLLQPDLLIDWFTVDPAARYLVQEGERVHPICRRLANESAHFEQMAGEHDLSAFFALRTMDELLSRNMMTFLDLMDAEHYDIVIGDEAWEVDWCYHRNPELKRQPFVFLTDFVGCLPMDEADAREAELCADRNADDIEHIARYPYVRDASLFIGNADDVTEQRFGPDLPGIRDWTQRNFDFCGYTLPFDPEALADTDRLRAKHGYGADERLVIASVGGTAVGGPLLRRIAEAFPHMRRADPGLRMVLVAGPRLATALPEFDGLEVRPYVHNLFEHLACADLALVQGGLTTCMELVATQRPFLSFPLRNHFEQCVHVRRRLTNYAADNTVHYHEVTPRELADRAMTALHTPVQYRAVETGGAAVAARRILSVLENRGPR
ncbi:MAG: alpha/beta fold hydrolase [Gemmatimonadota bacterium]